MKLVLIHDNIIENEILDSFSSDTIIRKINDYPTIDSLINSIDTNNFTHLAFIYHSYGSHIIPFYEKQNNKYNYINDNIINLINYIKSGNNSVIVDILSCYLNSTEFINEIETIKTELDIIIRYSLDEKGNFPQGNWIQESDNIDVKDIYFTEEIDKWNGTLIFIAYSTNFGKYGPIYRLNLATNEVEREYLNIDINGNPINQLYDDNFRNIKYQLSNVISWGSLNDGGNSSGVASQLGSDVVSVYNTWNAFAALKSNGSVITWGNVGGGSNSSSVSGQLSSGVIALYSTTFAFAALKSDGSVVTWGKVSEGGDSSTVSGQLSSGVVEVYANRNAFAALKSDGSVVTWGLNTDGGDSSSVSASLTSDVKTIYVNLFAFAALKTNGEVITWGLNTSGGDSSSVSAQLTSNVVVIYSTNNAFAALKNDGSVITWGNVFEGGNSSSVSAQLTSNVKTIYSSELSFAALKNDGSVVTWGGNGGDSSSVSAQLTSNVVTIYSSRQSFAALKTDGSVITWGFSSEGGDSSSVSSELTSNVKAVFSTAFAFAALKTDGSVVIWGSASLGGTKPISGVDDNVQTIYGTTRAFAALKNNGSVVIWGSASHGGVNNTCADLNNNIITIYSNSSAFVALREQSRWTQLGNDIDGEAAGDQSGYSVSLSSDGTIVAIGATSNDDNGSSSGHVIIYEWSGTNWNQKGSDIDGEAGGDQSGWSVSLSSDGTIVAIGSPFNDGNGSNSGHIRIYEWSGSEWVQKGNDINGEAGGDLSGWSVSLSSDGTIVAIGSPYNDGNGSNSGHVRIYEWSGTNWNQKGIDIDGEAGGDNSGFSISLSSDGNIVAIGAPNNNGATGGAFDSRGHVRIFEWSGSNWVQKGSDIDGEATSDESGYSISLSSDGTIIAIGAIYNDSNTGNIFDNRGHVRIYEWSGTAWVQKGDDIDGENMNDQSGFSVSISSDGTIVAIGSIGSDNNGSNSGRVKIYQWSGSEWVQIGGDIDGEATGDLSGSSVSLSSDGTIVAIGAINNDGTTGINSDNRGHVRIFQLYQPLSETPGAVVKINSINAVLYFTSNGIRCPSAVGSEPGRIYELTENIIFRSDVHMILGAEETFDGKGFTVNMNGIVFGGLFKTVGSSLETGSVVRNLGVLGGIISLDGGAIIRKSQSYFSVNSCYSTGIISNFCGGIAGAEVGENGFIMVTNCYSTGSIGLSSGGIVGPNLMGQFNIQSCYSTGSIGNSAGGITGNRTGNVQLNNPSSIVSCYSTGAINNSAGGIVGSDAGIDNGSLTIRSCYSTGVISGFNSGGIAGANASGSGSCIITFCYTTGDITGVACGGIAGPTNSSNLSISSSFSNHVVGNIEGVISSELKARDGNFLLPQRPLVNNSLDEMLNNLSGVEWVEDTLGPKEYPLLKSFLNSPWNGILNKIDNGNLITVEYENYDSIVTIIYINGTNIASIDENNSINAEIGTVSLIYPDINNSNIYSLIDVKIGGISQLNPTDYFGIIGNKLVAKRTFDYEDISEYVVRVNINDGINDFVGNFTILINNINEMPSEIQITNNSIIEGEDVGVEIGSLITIDDDLDNTYTYSVTKVIDKNGIILSNPLNYFTIIGDKLVSTRKFDYNISDKYDITINVFDGLNNFKDELRIIVLKLFTPYSNLPLKYKPNVFYMVTLYDSIEYKINFMTKGTNNSSNIYLTVEDIHPFKRSDNYNISKVNFLKSQFSVMSGEYTIGYLNKYTSSDGNYVIGFSNDEEKHYVLILNIPIVLESYINNILNTDKKLPLISLNQKNYVFYYTPKYFFDYIDSSTRSNVKFNRIFNDSQIDNESDEIGDKNSMIYNNHNNVALENFTDLKNLDASTLIDPDNFNLEMLPKNINSKNRYYYVLGDKSENRNSEINIILKLSNGIINERLGFYNVKYNNNGIIRDYKISYDNFNVVLYNYKDTKIGPMAFSKTGEYFYKSLRTEDYGLNMIDLQDARFTFVIKLQDYNIPINLNSEYIPITKPLKVLNNENETRSILLNRINNKFEIRSLYNNKYDNIILNLDNNDVRDINSNILNSLFVEDTIINIFVFYYFNSEPYYFNIKNVGSNEFLGSETLKLPFNFILKHLTSFADSNGVNRLETIYIIMFVNKFQIKSYTIDLSNYNIKNNRIKIFDRELLIINRQNINRNFTILETDLVKNDYMIVKQSSTTTRILDRSVAYFYKININSENNVGYSFERNGYVISKRKGRVTEYITYYSLLYNKDMIINDIFSALDDNLSLGSNQEIKIEFYDFVRPGRIIDSFKINQEIMSYKTVGSVEFQDEVNNIIEDEINKISSLLETETETNITENEEINTANEKIQTLNNILDEMRNFGFFETNTNLEVNITEIKNLKPSDVKFLQGVKDSDNEDVSIISDNELSSARNIASQVIGTRANKILITATNIDGSIATFEILKINNTLIIRLTKFIKRIVPLILGSLVVNIVVTHLINNYSLDNNILPGAEINNFNYSETALRIWSLREFKATAINIRFLSENVEIQEENKIILRVIQSGGYYEILVYDDTYSSIFESGSEYLIDIEQEGHSNKYFILPFYIRGIIFRLEENYTDELLNVSFNEEMIINSYMKYLLVKFGNMEDVTNYLRDERGGVYKNIEDVDFSEVTLDNPIYIYSEANDIIIDNNSYAFEMLFDKYYYIGYYEGVLALKGLAYGGSGIVEITYYGPGTVPCITKDSYILTPHGEKCITELKEGDLVRTSGGENVPIVKKMVRKVIRLNKMPYIIPKGHYGENVPNRDTYISPNHAYQVKQENGEMIWKYPKHQSELNQTDWETVTYYNIKLPDYHKHQFVCNGLSLESWNDNDPNIKPYTWVRKGKNIYKEF